MRATTAAAATTLVMLVAAGWGAVAIAPWAGSPPGPPTTAAPTTAVTEPAVDRSVVRVAPELLDDGVALPDGLVQTRPTTRLLDGELRGWETAFDLNGVPHDEVLRVLRADLTRMGFELRTGDDDVFGVRRHDDRWEIVVARVDAGGTAGDGAELLHLAIGSRPE